MRHITNIVVLTKGELVRPPTLDHNVSVVDDRVCAAGAAYNKRKIYNDNWWNSWRICFMRIEIDTMTGEAKGTIFKGERMNQTNCRGHLLDIQRMSDRSVLHSITVNVMIMLYFTDCHIADHGNMLHSLKQSQLYSVTTRERLMYLKQSVIVVIKNNAMCRARDLWVSILTSAFRGRCSNFWSSSGEWDQHDNE